jgi:hypothetical protein
MIIDLPPLPPIIIDEFPSAALSFPISRALLVAACPYAPLLRTIPLPAGVLTCTSCAAEHAATHARSAQSVPYPPNVWHSVSTVSGTRCEIMFVGADPFSSCAVLFRAVPRGPQPARTRPIQTPCVVYMPPHLRPEDARLSAAILAAPEVGTIKLLAIDCSYLVADTDVYSDPAGHLTWTRDRLASHLETVCTLGARAARAAARSRSSRHRSADADHPSPGAVLLCPRSAGVSHVVAALTAARLKVRNGGCPFYAGLAARLTSMGLVDPASNLTLGATHVTPNYALLVASAGQTPAAAENAFLSHWAELIIDASPNTPIALVRSGRRRLASADSRSPLTVRVPASPLPEELRHTLALLRPMAVLPSANPDLSDLGADDIVPRPLRLERLLRASLSQPTPNEPPADRLPVQAFARATVRTPAGATDRVVIGPITPAHDAPRHPPPDPSASAVKRPPSQPAARLSGTANRTHTAPQTQSQLPRSSPSSAPPTSTAAPRQPNEVDVASSRETEAPTPEMPTADTDATYADALRHFAQWGIVSAPMVRHLRAASQTSLPPLAVTREQYQRWCHAGIKQHL